MQLPSLVTIGGGPLRHMELRVTGFPVRWTRDILITAHRSGQTCNPCLGIRWAYYRRDRLIIL